MASSQAELGDEILYAPARCAGLGVAGLGIDIRRAARMILDACDEANGVEDEDSMYRQVTVMVSVVVEGANGVNRCSFIYILKVRTHRQKAL
jgi:hypothetical protein